MPSQGQLVTIWPPRTYGKVLNYISQEGKPDNHVARLVSSPNRQNFMSCSSWLSYHVIYLKVPMHSATPTMPHFGCLSWELGSIQPAGLNLYHITKIQSIHSLQPELLELYRLRVYELFLSPVPASSTHQIHSSPSQSIQTFGSHTQ